MTTGNIDLDLGLEYTINQMALWDVGTAYDIDEFTVFTPLTSDFSTATNVGTFNLTGTGGPPTARGAEVFDLNGSVGRYLRLSIASNRGQTNTMLGELALDVSTVSTPEPASLTLCGLAALMPSASYIRRRRLKRQLKQ